VKMAENSSQILHNVQQKKRPCDEPAQRQARQKKMRESAVSKRGSIDYYYKCEVEKSSLKEKMVAIKALMGEGNPNKTTTLKCLQEVFDYYISNNNVPLPTDTGSGEIKEPQAVPQYIWATLNTSKAEEIFLSTPSAVANLVSRVCSHDAACKHELLSTQSNIRMQHSMQLGYTCAGGHTVNWVSSPHVEGGKHLVNLRMAHAFFTSGILPVQYRKFCEAANIGAICDNTLTSLQSQYKDIVHTLTIESTENALMEEMAASVIVSDKMAIDVIMDARHCWRANARFTDVVCLGDITHKVLRVETISKIKDDPCSQRHELIGVKRIYEYFDSVCCPIDIHCHDSNSSVGKFLREERGETRRSLDTWHATKGITRGMKKIATGPNKHEGKEWHAELSDKCASIRTHIYWSMKNCAGDEGKLRDNMDNIVSHYKNNHEKCSEESRCKKDGVVYIPSKCKLTEPKAEQLLVKFVHSLPVYKLAECYSGCKDTHYVESYNNAILQYHNKRIAFGDQTYKLRTDLSILDWNENVDRPLTSRQEIQEASNPRRQIGLPVHKKKTYNFKDQLWIRWLDYFYSSC